MNIQHYNEGWASFPFFKVKINISQRHFYIQALYKSKTCELIHIPTIEIEVGLLIYTDHWTASIWFAMLSSGFDVVVTDSSSTGFRGTLALMRSWKKAPSLSPPPKISTSSCSWFSWQYGRDRDWCPQRGIGVGSRRIFIQLKVPVNVKGIPLSTRDYLGITF